MHLRMSWLQIIDNRQHINNGSSLEHKSEDYQHYSMFYHATTSGVTRVGVTRGGN